MKVSTNDDSITATSDWQWMTYMRLGDKAAAAKVLERITPKMDILENGSYHSRLLMYKGLEKPETLLDSANADDLTIATQGYGVGNYYLVTGDTAKAKEIFDRVLAGKQWAAFGYIAAEVDRAKMPGGLRGTRRSGCIVQTAGHTLDLAPWTRRRPSRSMSRARCAPTAAAPRSSPWRHRPCARRSRTSSAASSPCIATCATKPGPLRRHLNVFVNSDNVRDLDGVDTTLAPGDVVTILPAVSGG